jgi:hypothetical protein
VFVPEVLAERIAGREKAEHRKEKIEKGKWKPNRRRQRKKRFNAEIAKDTEN